MSGISSIWCHLLGIAVSSTWVMTANCAFSQITPDKTLPNNSSVTINGSTFNITGGTQVGRNLFHSFQQFSVPTKGTASFNNAVDIRNIFSRITGGSVSNIDGIIQANGAANVFILNPSGIVFGKNAQLNIGGSFVSSTFEALVWPNGAQLSATNPGGPSSLLTLVGDPSGFLSSVRSPQSITSSGNTLQVPTGQSLLLLGGNITLDSSKLSAPGGKIELAGVTGAGTVGLEINGNIFRFNVPDGLTRADVLLRNDAVISVAADGATDAGSINIKANGISVESQNQTALDASSNNSSNSNGKKLAGSISLDATGSILITGSDANIVISTYGNNNSSGSGDISLQADDTISLNHAFFNVSNFGGDPGNILLQGNKSVSLANNSSLVSTAFGRGISGNITIKSFGPVSFQNSLVSTAIGSNAPLQNNLQLGNAGNITISGESVFVTDGTEISSRTFSGQRSGDVIINATDTVEISGQAPIFPRPDTDRANTYAYSVLATSTEQYAGDVAGNIKITTNSLRVSDGATLRAESNGKFGGGNINIHANTVELTGGGQLLTTASSQGDAGSINLDVKDFVLLSGFNPNKITLFNTKANAVTQDELGQTQDNGSGLPKYTPEKAKEDGQTQASAIPDIGSSPANSGMFANTVGTSSTGNGGNIKITSGQLTVREQAQVTASSFGSGNAGNLEVTARSIQLNNGTLTAQTNSGNGGNITLTPQDFLLLRNGSQISTTAGSSSANGNGGNITINASNGFIVAAPNENNEITANAFNGSGGKVQINALGIYNFQQPSLKNLETLLATSDPNKLELYLQQTPTNNITAISLTSPTLSGQVNIITPDIDPSRGLTTLPTITEDTPKLVSSSCTALNKANGGSSFTVTGRGGLPPSPDESLTTDALWTDTRLPVATAQQHHHKTYAAKVKPQPIAIIPATGWVFNDKGEVTLISTATNATSANTPTSCPVR